jgi:hypothetical protein
MEDTLDPLNQAYAALTDAFSEVIANPDDEDASKKWDEAETRVETARAAFVAASEASKK